MSASTAVASTGWFSVGVESTQRRVDNRRVVIGRKCQVDKPEEVFQHLGVSLHTGLPVFIDASFQVVLGVFDLLRVRRCVVVVPGVGCDGFQVVRVCRFPSGCE